MATVMTPAFVSLEQYKRGEIWRYVLLVTIDHYTTLRFELGMNHSGNEELHNALANLPVRNE